MSSERLYYTDAYLVEFDAVVREVEPSEDKWLVALDRTAFYPTSGGQPFDTGTIDDARVSDVIDREDGGIVHLVDRMLEKDSRVRGHVDWGRRFDHMQQHTGQHLLSAAFEHEAGAKTVSFHLGASAATIDLNKELTAEQIVRVEDTANRILWEDREVCVRFVTAGEAARLPLRKEPAREGELRIIEIKDYDLSACGGTHVSRSGAIGMIAVSGFERFKGGLRVEFLCGARVLRSYRALQKTVDRSVHLLSVLPEELPGAIEKLQAAGRMHQKALDGLYERLAVHEAAGLVAAGEKIGAFTFVGAVAPGWDASGLKRLAAAAATSAKTAVVLLSAESPSLIVMSRSPDLTFDTGVVLKKLIEQFGGKGGGKGSMAQGGGLVGEPHVMLDAAKRLVTAEFSISTQPTQ